VNDGSVDLERLRGELRHMSRGQLLMIADRAIDLVPGETLHVLVGDFVQIPRLELGQPCNASLLDQVHMFCEASLRGDYFESFDVNGKNCTEQSKGTDAFIAGFDRLTGQCLGAAAEGSFATAREAFERLFALLRRIDEDPAILFFADEGGSREIPVAWHAVLPLYFRCLAEDAPGETFARAVDTAIADFCDYQRADHLAAAQSVANAEQPRAELVLTAKGVLSKAKRQGTYHTTL
jgi:hypothetical protein